MAQTEDTRRFVMVDGGESGEPITFADFCKDNSDDSFGDPKAEFWDPVDALRVGEEVRFGGGAWATSTIRRVA